MWWRRDHSFAATTAFKNPEVVLEAVFEGSIQSVTAHGSYVAVAEC